MYKASHCRLKPFLFLYVKQCIITGIIAKHRGIFIGDTIKIIRIGCYIAAIAVRFADEAIGIKGRKGTVMQVGIEVGAIGKTEGISCCPASVAWIIKASAEVDPAGLWINSLAGKAPRVAHFRGLNDSTLRVDEGFLTKRGVAIGFARLACSGVNEANDMSLIVMSGREGASFDFDGNGSAKLY